MNRLVQSEPADGSDASLAFGSTQPMTVVRSSGELAATRHQRIPSYHPTRWPIVNRALDITDAVTRGYAGVIQRVVNYLMFGGAAAVVNLAVLTFVYYGIHLPINSRIHYAIAFAVATEISIFVNFIPQDLVTFRHLPGHSRSWLMRCLRFHTTSVGGIIVTAIVSFTMREAVGLHATLSQAIAIIVALFFNFTFHHVFTYRHVKHPA